MRVSKENKLEDDTESCSTNVIRPWLPSIPILKLVFPRFELDLEGRRLDRHCERRQDARSKTSITAADQRQEMYSYNNLRHCATNNYHMYATQNVRDVNATLFFESQPEYLPIHMRSYPTNIYTFRKDSKLRRNRGI